MVTVATERSKRFEELLTKVRAIVTFFKRSTKAADDLQASQTKTGKTKGELKKLKKDEPTRWTSSYQMLDSFIQLAEEIGVVILRHDNVPMLSGSDLSAAIEGRNILQPIMHVITELESEKKSLAEKVIPLLSMMKTVLESFNSKTECVKQLKSALLDQFNSRFQHIELVDGLAIATLLDPRFKALHLQPISHANAVTMVSEKLKYFEREERGRRCASTKIVDNVSSQLNNGDGNLWKIHDRLVVERTASMEHDKPGNISSELRNFLHQQVIPRTSDPLEAWDTIKTEYPNLYYIA
ncbi:zinc finger BED domain-containing protein 4-like [Wyeomyia smithii]|uniref:zinc finger BED domain-containing protein 4-like n=1 Tax=Wyeomyia smithii TaxID=174621 RepID=UPI002467B26C|nr:zinc finger BED domain-containing protein 4-like [Wyeomyia smithii]